MKIEITKRGSLKINDIFKNCAFKDLLCTSECALFSEPEIFKDEIEYDRILRKDVLIDKVVIELCNQKKLMCDLKNFKDDC